MTDKRKQKQKQRQTQRQTVIVNVGETKRKRTRTKKTQKQVQEPRIIQQFVPQYIPQFMPSFDMGQVRQLVQSEIRMLEPPKPTLRQMDDIRNFEAQQREQEVMSNVSYEDDIALMKRQAQEDAQPIASTSGLQSISNDKPALSNSALNAPVRLPDDSANPVKSLDNRPLPMLPRRFNFSEMTEEELSERAKEQERELEKEQERIYKKKNKARSESRPPPKEEGVFGIVEEELPVVLPKRRGRPPKRESQVASSSSEPPQTIKEQKAKAKKKITVIPS